ncbi:MAG: hypothetical protein A2070_06210 [Bdellovibrionales bacterium GWC1_52_8]|nr:MAG: hypothetical protein A2Z97_07370 [Bdellovibrionales bacterium GWB1_52_6]OFZ06509.1 MAG: hypothetical protein A2X97_16960 [Bdellovibrionales bacterium GWA1_52_35]OFZ35822.1 MAG: hypothetical protein A2070_06210 [Bdellovibrionales bacterium GWC1_52_8]HCM39513.1 peptidase M52 [Bdellovibrionales bacterium]
MKTIIIGLGNPILTDDSVGIKVARRLRDLPEVQEAGIEVLELYAGGIRLIEALRGYERALIVDAMTTGQNQPGTIREFSSIEQLMTRNSICLHDMDLPMALELAKIAGVKIPEQIKIWGIEAKDVENFSEELTEDVRSAVGTVVGRVLTELHLATPRRAEANL